MGRTVRQLCDLADTILNEYMDKLMMIPKQTNATNENWFASIPPWARATGVLTLCIGTATGLIYFLDQSSKNATVPVASNPSANPSTNPPSANTDLSSPLETNTPNSNLPTPSNPKPPFSTPNSPIQSLTPFTNNSNNITNQSNSDSNINPIMGMNPNNRQTRQSLNIPVGDGTNQPRNINPQTPNISTTSIPEIDSIAATKTEQNPQVMPQISPIVPRENNRQTSVSNLSPNVQRPQIRPTINNSNPIRQQSVISVQTPPPPTTLPILPNQSSPITSLPQIDNIAVNRNIKKTPQKATNIPSIKPPKTIISQAQTEESKPKIKPLTEIKDLSDSRPIHTNINNPSNRSKQNISSNTQNIARGQRKMAVNNPQTNPKRENKVTQNKTRQNPATPPVSDPKFNPPVGVSVLPTLPPPPSLNPSNNNLFSNTNNIQVTPPPTSKSEISQKKMTRDIAAQIPPLPPAPKIANSEKVKNDSYPAKNRDEILIENPDNLAINTPNIMETPPPNIIIPQIAEAKEYLQTRWKVPDGLNKSIEYILVLDSDGTITQIQPLGETAKKYREATNIPAPGDKFVSPLSLGKLPKIRAVFNLDGKVQTFLQSE